MGVLAGKCEHVRRGIFGNDGEVLSAIGNRVSKFCLKWNKTVREMENSCK